MAKRAAGTINPYQLFKLAASKRKSYEETSKGPGTSEVFEPYRNELNESMFSFSERRGSESDKFEPSPHRAGISLRHDSRGWTSMYVLRIVRKPLLHLGALRNGSSTDLTWQGIDLCLSMAKKLR